MEAFGERGLNQLVPLVWGVHFEEATCQTRLRPGCSTDSQDTFQSRSRLAVVGGRRSRPCCSALPRLGAVPSLLAGVNLASLERVPHGV